MFHKAIKVEYGEGTIINTTFENGEIIEYDVSVLFEKYPQLEKLKDRNLFTSGKLMGTCGISWSEDLDLETETIYQEGKKVL